MYKLFVAAAIAVLLPGFAWAAESCHHAETAAAASGDHAAHHALPTGVAEEIPQTTASSETHGMEGDCPHHPGIVHSCSAQRALMKCGTHGCCIKSELPVADSGLSPKVSPEMALSPHEGLNPFSVQGPVSPYLLEELSNNYPPVPRPPAA